MTGALLFAHAPALAADPSCDRLLTEIRSQDAIQSLGLLFSGDHSLKLGKVHRDNSAWSELTSQLNTQIAQASPETQNWVLTQIEKRIKDRSFDAYTLHALLTIDPSSYIHFIQRAHDANEEIRKAVLLSQDEYQRHPNIQNQISDYLSKTEIDANDLSQLIKFRSLPYIRFSLAALEQVDAAILHADLRQKKIVAYLPTWLWWVFDFQPLIMDLIEISGEIQDPSLISALIGRHHIYLEELNRLSGEAHSATQALARRIFKILRTQVDLNGNPSLISEIGELLGRHPQLLEKFQDLMEEAKADQTWRQQRGSPGLDLSTPGGADLAQKFFEQAEQIKNEKRDLPITESRSDALLAIIEQGYFPSDVSLATHLFDPDARVREKTIEALKKYPYLHRMAVQSTVKALKNPWEFERGSKGQEAPSWSIIADLYRKAIQRNDRKWVKILQPLILTENGSSSRIKAIEAVLSQIQR